MHILLVIHSLGGGGAERIASQMAEYWCKKNYRVSVLTVAGTEKNRYELPEKAELCALGIEKATRGPLSALSYNIGRIFIIRRAIKNIKPDIVVAMMTEITVVTGFACIGLPVKCIGSERNYPGVWPISRFWRQLRRCSYRFVDLIIAQTSVSEKWLYENTNAKRVKAINNPLALPLPILEPIVKPGKLESEKWVIGIGRLSKQKQFDHLIRIFSAVAEKHNDWNLIIIGEGEEKPELQKLIEQSSLNGRIRLVGRVGNIADWFHAADVFAFTSHVEGFPNALIEAMAHGLPCVSYDCLTGPAEVIDHGVNGMLVSPNDEHGFTVALDELLCSAQLRLTLSDKALGISERLSPERIMSQWEDEIAYLLENQVKM